MAENSQKKVLVPDCKPAPEFEICQGEAFLNSLPFKSSIGITFFAHFEAPFNPFVSIGRTGTSKCKVKVRDICLNISFLT